MAYFPPYIDESGLHIPTYTDILEDLIAREKAIFGSDIYLGNDSMDYQYLSVIALKLSDTLQAVQLAYNNRSPVTAIGSGLDALVKINGLRRKTPSYSTCSVTLSGTAGTVITAGVVVDVSGNRWELPASVIIEYNGTVTVTAKCQTIGAVAALPGTITKISTPTKGWLSVTNNAAAVQGQPVETDAQLRTRQAISTDLPSQTLLSGTTAGIASVSGVTRYKVYENDTNITDAKGLPPHSITCVVEGGVDNDIASEIYARKGIGCYTNGTTTVTIKDLYNRDNTIRFYRPTYVPIYVGVSIAKKSGYTNDMTAKIQQAITNYLNSLSIGETLVFSVLNAVVMTVQPSLSNPVFAVTALTAGKTANPTGTADIAIGFNEVSQGVLANVTVAAS